MLDLSYFQNSGNVNTQIFTNAGSWVTWQKPRSAKFVNILCIGSGGGGSNGVSSSVSVRGSGGGGGGGGGIVRAQFQASILPDILYVYTGAGGTGSLGGSQKTTIDPGQNGEKSYICLIPDTSSVSNIVVTSGNLSARGATNNGGAGETIATVANAIFLNLGTFIAVAGIAGTNGGAASGNAGITPSQITTGGTGGNGVGAAGGFTAAGFYPTVPTTLSVAGVGLAGKNGFMFTKPVLAFLGGSGGGGAGTGPGGKGGDASYGCGGGGGGGCQNVGGNGGRGGDGLIIITTSF
jgi:hypothetical protein